MAFALSFIAGSSTPLGWLGQGCCAYSIDKTNEETKTERVKDIDA